MSGPLYPDAPDPVRQDLEDAHRETWRRIAAPGTWWTGAERVAMAAEVRRARRCGLCAERKAALSPFAIQGRHDAGPALPEPAVDVIHRLVTDPGRLTRSWCRGVIEAGLSEGHYVELVAVVAKATALDLFPLALGAEPLPLPEPRPGAPSQRRPARARADGAWVPLVPAGPEGGEDARSVYGERASVPNIGRALSLVPDEVHGMHVLAQPHYMSLEHVVDPGYVEPGRTLDRLQTELVAARVSAINECFY